MSTSPGEGGKYLSIFRSDGGGSKMADKRIWWGSGNFIEKWKARENGSNWRGHYFFIQGRHGGRV